jgi:hypothetical protein
VVATARKIAERVYRLLKYGADYVRQGIEEYEAKYRERVLKNLARKANELGYEPTADRLDELLPDPWQAAPSNPAS